MKTLARGVLLLALCLAGSGAAAQRRADSERYDPTFRKYSKRFFGPGFDWQYFKAQGQAESGLDPRARSRVGARGVMQLMPGTYAVIKRNRRERMGAIDDPEWNIAAAILHDRDLWLGLTDHPDAEERIRFMFGSYNAGEGPIMRAKYIARTERLDDRRWSSIERIAPKVERWRYRETLPYVQKIESNYTELRADPHKENAARKGGAGGTGRTRPAAALDPPAVADAGVAPRGVGAPAPRVGAPAAGVGARAPGVGAAVPGAAPGTHAGRSKGHR